MISNLRKIRFHTFHITLLLIFSVGVGSVLGGMLVQKAPILASFDTALYLLIINGPHPEFLNWLLYPINTNFLKLPYNIPTYLYFMNVLFLGYLLIFKRKFFVWAIIAILGGTFLTLSIAAVDWWLVFRERPFLTLPTTLPQSETNIIKLFSSFPSGHARETMLYCTIMANFIPKFKVFFYLFAFFIAFSRVYIGAHYPTDVIAGAAIGYLCGKSMLMICRELQIILDNRRKGIPHGDKPKS